MTSSSVLVVEDDPSITEVTVFALERAGHLVRHAATGEDALAQARRATPDIVVLDVGLPGIDGLEVCRRLRATKGALGTVPILFLSARDEEIDRVIGLEIGGDDYVTKPFSPRELAARVAAILKRASPKEVVPDEVVAHGALALDAARHEASFGGHALPLTATEFAMLRALAARPGLVLSRDQLMTAAYPDNVHVSDRTIDSHVRNLRAKLADAGAKDVIETVHGVGFKLGACTAAPGRAEPGLA